MAGRRDKLPSERRGGRTGKIRRKLSAFLVALYLYYTICMAVHVVKIHHFNARMTNDGRAEKRLTGYGP